MRVAHLIGLASSLILALTAAPARAGWEKFGETDVAVHYLDLASVKKDGNTRRVWELQDFKKPDSTGALSQRFLWEFVCNLGQYRRLASSSHSERQLNGAIIQMSSDPGAMLAVPSHIEGLVPQVQTTLTLMFYVPPNSNISAIQARVCAD